MNTLATTLHRVRTLHQSMTSACHMRHHQKPILLGMKSLPRKGAGARLLRTHVKRLFRIPTDLFRVAIRHLVAWLLTVSVRAIVRKVAKAEVAAVLAKHRMLLNVRALPGVTDLHCLLVYP